MEFRDYHDLLDRLHEPNELKRYFRFLHETTLELINNLELNNLLTAIVNRAAELGNTKHAFLYLLGQEEDIVTLTVGIGLFKNKTFQIKKGEDMVGKVWETGKTMLFNNYCEWEGHSTDPLFDNINSVLGVPLKVNSEVIGVIGLMHLENDRIFCEEELNMLSQFAELAALALANAKLHDTVKKELAERKVIEKALRRSEAIHRALLDAIPDTLLWVNREGGLLGCKAGVKNLLDINIEDYIGRSIYDLFPGEVTPFFRSAISAALDIGIIDEFECRVNTLGGWKDWEVRVVTGDDDEALVIIREITDRKLAEAKAQEAKKALASIEKLTALATISAGIAHEINQPLTSIKIAADSMLYWFSHDQKIELEEMFDYIKDISAQAGRIGNIVKSVCSIMNGQNFPIFTSCNLNGAVEAALKHLSSQLKFQGINVTKNLTDDSTLIRGEETILEQVVVNLLTNSIQALEKIESSGREILINTTVDDKVVLEIQDNGLGVEMEVMDEIYNPFFTTKPREENMGLGLFLVHGIVSTYGGQLHASNNERNGATFRIQFPLMEKAVAKGE